MGRQRGLDVRPDRRIRRLTPLLADPEFATVSGTNIKTHRHYLVRAKAHEVLTTWGVAHKTPVLDEPLP